MRFTLVFATAIILQASAQAHFIWLVPASDGSGNTTVQVCFGEDASADDPTYLQRLKDMKLQRVTGEDSPTPLQTRLTDGSLSADIDRFEGNTLLIASHDMGVFDRGDAKFRLNYYAKGGPAVSSNAWQTTKTADDLKLDVVPTVEDGKVTVTVRFGGKPMADAQVVASGPGLDDFEGMTDKNGHVAFDIADPGMYSIRARHIDTTAGEVDGKAYPETRHYCTVATMIGQDVIPVASKDVATLPECVTSFGAAILDGSLYLYGGHTGTAHSYSKEEQSHELTRLDLATGEWETVVDGPHLQGLALVAHDANLYRIGGFTAKNAEGDDHDLWSLATVASFDPADNAWTDLPPLPEPRSSFDAAVVGDSIFVVGGWSMPGPADNIWHTTAWKMNLSQASPEWEPVPDPPFQRRALATAAHDGKLYVIGGMQKEGGPTPDVDIFDPVSGQWSTGPELVGASSMTGFGASAFATGGRLYVSTVNGHLLRLSKDGAAWDIVGQTPSARFFHRLLPLDNNHLLVVGGANMSIGKFEEVEVLDVSPAESSTSTEPALSQNDGEE